MNNSEDGSNFEDKLNSEYVNQIDDYPDIENWDIGNDNIVIRVIISIILIVIILGLGGFVFIKMIKSAKPPEIKKTIENIPLVETVKVRRADHNIKIRGYGNTAPFQTLYLQPEVTGMIVWVSPLFDIGGILKKGEPVIRIENTKYDLAVKSNEAALNQLNAQVLQLEKEESNTKSNIDILKKSLDLARKELERNQRLLEKKSIAQSVVDQLESAYLGQMASLQTQKNILNTLAPRLSQLKAQIMAAHSRLKSSQTDLDKTELKIPFDAIIVEKNASLGEIAGINTKLGLLYSIDRARLEIPVSGEDFHWLLRDKNSPGRPDESAAESAYNLFDTARVITENNGFSVEWPARVVSTGGRVNTSTRTINLILEIDDPFNIYHKAQNPPLAAGMFCRADFTGRTLKNVFIIPRKAYYQNGTVKIFKDNRAWIKKVEIIASQEDSIIISDDSWDDETMVILTKSELILNDMKVLPAQAETQGD